MERALFLAAAIASLALCALSLLGWEPPVAWSPPSLDADNYRPADLPTAPFLPPAFADAGAGAAGAASPFAAASEKRELPPEALEVPEPPLGLPVALPFEPSPDFAAPGYEPFCFRHPAARAVPKPEDLPGAETLEPLKALVSNLPAAPAPAKDPKAPEVDRVISKSKGMLEGTLVEDTEQQVRLRDRSGAVLVLPRRDVQQVLRATRLSEQYEQRRAAVPPSDVKALTDFAAWCAERGLAREAAQAYEAAIAAGKTDPRGYFGLAELARREGDLDAECDACLRAVAGGTSGVEQFLVRLSWIYADLGLAEPGQKTLEAATKAHPTFVEGRLLYCLALLEAGRLEKAAEQLGRALEIPPADPVAASFLAYVDGRLLLAKNDPKGAVASLQKAVAVPAAASGVSPRDPAGAWRALGSAQAHLGAFKEAANAFVEAVRVAPDDPRAWVDLATLYLLADRLAEARVCCEEARRRDPSTAAPWVGLALAALLEQKPDDAFALVQSATKLDPGDGFVRALLAHLLLVRGDPAGAARELSAPLGRARGFPGAVYDFGLASLRQKSFGLAAGSFARLVTADTTRPELPCALGLALLGRGEVARAETRLRQALRLAPEYPPALEGLAYLDYVSGRVPEAVAGLNRVLAAAAGEAYATRALALIQEAATRTFWEDAFDRADADQVGKGWFQSEKFGVQVSLAGRRARFAGTQALEDGGESALERVVRADAFVRVEADLDLADAGNALLGLRVAFKTQGGARQSGLRFGRNAKGKLVCSVAAEGDAGPRWREVADAPAGSTLRLGLEKVTTEQEPTYALLVDGKTVGSQKAALLEVGGENVICGVFGQAAKGEKWGLAVTRFRIVERKRK